TAALDWKKVAAASALVADKRLPISPQMRMSLASIKRETSGEAFIISTAARRFKVASEMPMSVVNSMRSAGSTPSRLARPSRVAAVMPFRCFLSFRVISFSVESIATNIINQERTLWQMTTGSASHKLPAMAFELPEIDGARTLYEFDAAAGFINLVGGD